MMVSHGARRVAEAVLDLARGHRDFDAWLQDLRTLNDRLGSDQVLHILDHPDVPFSEKKALVDRLAGRSVRPEGLHVAYYLVSKRRAHQLGDVVEALQGLVNEVRNVRVASVTTAKPLDADQEEALKRSLGERFGGTVTLHKDVDPSIVGGAIVRVGDLLMDGSVNGRLAALREQLIRSVR